MNRKHNYTTMGENQEKLERLVNDIVNGSERIEAALDRLDYFMKCSDGRERLIKYRDNDETLLHLAAKFHENAILVEKLINLCPELLTVTRTGKYAGQTALHIAICKGNLKAVKIMVSQPEKDHLLTIPAIGSRFEYTVMMGELPLSVAAVTFNKDIVQELISAGAKITAQNSYGDTVFHSLVKYSAIHVGNEENVIQIMELLNNTLAKHSSDKAENNNVLFDETDPIAIWLLENNEHLTAFQLAARWGQVNIFNFILNLEGVYCRLDRHDGLFNINLYDITEIDDVAMQKWFKENRNTTSNSQIHSVDALTDVAVVNKNQTRFNELADPQEFQSILEMISKTDANTAFAFLKLPVIGNIIKDKWARYRWYYYAWAIFHLTHISLMMWYALERTKLSNIKSSQNVSQNISQETSRPPQYTESFVNTFTYFNISVSVLYLLLECRRYGLQKQRLHLSKIHHNGTYRVLLILFAVCAVVDSVWYISQPGNDYMYFLIASVLIGSWFSTFFLRAFKKFSFFTVMIQKIILSDLFRFSIIIGLELVCFTAMIYSQFVTSDPPISEFKTYSVSLLTLFNLMLGLSDITVFDQAKEPWLAAGLFVTFALLTYVLMINALIAMMSQTCTLVSSNKYVQWQMQHLSIILFIEKTLYSQWRICCGKIEKMMYSDVKKKTTMQDKRYFLEMDYLHTKYTKGKLIRRRRHLPRTLTSTASKGNGGQHTHRRKFRSTVSTIDVTDGNMTRHTDRSDKHEYCMQQRQRQATVCDGLHRTKQSAELVQEPQVDISTVYISSKT